MTNQTIEPVETETDDGATGTAPPSTPARRQRRVRFIIAAVVVVLLGGVGLLRWSPWSSGVPDGAALVVDGEVVTVKELDARMDALRALYGVVRPTEPKALDTFRRDAAKSIAVSMLLDEQIADRDIRISDKKARDALDRFVAEQFGDGGHEEFVRSLGNVGTSEKQVLDEIRRQLELRLLVDDVVGEVRVSDEALTAQFELRRAELGTPERRTVRNIVVADEATARDVRRRLMNGDDIAGLAAEVSIDRSTRDDGGDLGAVARDELEPAVGDAVFKARRGGVYGPVKGQFGWNVGRVDAIAPAQPAEFAAVRDSFRERLVAEEGARRWWRWITDLLKDADVRYADDYRPADPDAAPGAGTGLPPSPAGGDE